MSSAEILQVLAPRVTRRVETGAAADQISSLGQEQEWRAGWNELIDRDLLELVKHPEQLADEGIEPPSRPVMREAFRIAIEMRDNGSAPFLRAVPTPDGGIVFERGNRQQFEAIEIRDDCSIEYRLFRGSSLVLRSNLDLASAPAGSASATSL